MSTPNIPDIPGFIFTTQLVDGVPTLLVWQDGVWTPISFPDVIALGELEKFGNILEAEAAFSHYSANAVGFDCGTFGW